MNNKKLTRKELEKKVKRLSVCPSWKIYTRAAIAEEWKTLTENARVIVYCDLDNLHALNESSGHSEIDKRIKKVLKEIRKTDKVIISRWLNGDEIIFILNSGSKKSGAEGFIKRIMEVMNSYNLSATFSYTYEIKKNPYKTINPLDNKVQSSKNQNRRGIIAR